MKYMVPKFQSFDTDDGIYHQKQLVYGINNAFEIFQWVSEQNKGKIEGVKFISDDIISHVQNEAKLLKLVERLFKKIKLLGLKLNKDKCIFITDKLYFFGKEISTEGISPDKNKIKAIQHALRTSDVRELRSFIGLHMFQDLLTITVKNSCTS